MTTRRQTLTSAPSNPVNEDTQTTSSGGSASTTRTANNMTASPQDTANIQAGDSTGEGVLASIGFSPEPNPMGDLFSPTYHFSFYLDSDIPAQQGQGSEFVIAETGLTGMNIQDVSIDAVVGPNQNTKNALTTNIVIKIYEPYGAMLPDLLYLAAVKKQISNYLKAPWFLKLKLWGYDETGKKSVIGDDDNSGWTWQVSIIDINTVVTESGSMHTITCMPISEQALNNQICMLPGTATGEGQTVGDALNQIIKSMNDDAVNRYGSSTVPFIEYAVEARDYPYDTKVGVKNPLQHPITASAQNTSNVKGASGYGSQRGQFSPGTDFPAVVDMMMARSETAIKQARLSRELPPATGDDTEANIRDVVSMMHRIDTKVEYKVYNPVQGDYSKKITYIIKPYSSLRLLTSMGRAQAFDKEPTLNKKKAQFAKDNAFLRKQYDYIFTGENTEVLKFDISLNFTWAVSVPMYQAQNVNTGTPASVDPSKSAQGTKQANAAAGQAVTDAQTALDNFNDSHPDGTQLTPEDTANKQKLQDTLNAAKQTQSGTVAQLGKQTDQLEQAQPRKATPQSNSPTLDGEDLIYEMAQDPNSDQFKDLQGADQGSKSFLPITISQNADDPGLRAKQGTANDNNPYKSVYGTLLNQLYGTMDGNLQSIEVDIRGDPYWLGPGDKGVPYDDPSTDTRPNFMNGEHIFVFRFKLPQGYDDSTGTVSVPSDVQSSTGTTNPQPASGSGDGAQTNKGSGGNSNIFTGFYACVSVNNRFSEGRFIQTIQAVRIPGWSYENIIEGRQSTAPEDVSYDARPGPSSPQVSGGSAGSRGSGARTTNTTPRGVRNNNPGNLRNTPFAQRQPGYTGSDDNNFATFDTQQDGINAQETLLRNNYLDHLTTVPQVIDKYLGANVPGNYNSIQSKQNYISYVSGQLGKSSGLTQADTPALAQAMRNFENGTR